MFQNSILKNSPQDEKLIASRWANYQLFKDKIDFIKTVKEEKYQEGFLKDIFENCLGYTLDSTNPLDYTLEREKKNETDAKKADGVILLDGVVVGVIELKDQKTKRLDETEAQAFNYHNSHSNSRYIIISNFDELRFYIDKKTAYEKFNLFSLSYDEFKKLHLLLSFESIKANLPLKLKEKSSNFEAQISKELYRDFSAFRTQLFENIVKNNFACNAVIPTVISTDTDAFTPTVIPILTPTVIPAKAGIQLDSCLRRSDESLYKPTLLRLTQKLCDRIIFILFAEDRGLLRYNTIKEIREEFTNQKFTSYSLYDIYKFYFDAINMGNSKLDIPRYNGGLFSKDELLDNLIIDDSCLDIKAQKLSDYDFASDISVNILGHIFEQSLSDLEEIQANIENTAFDKKKSKRKKDGIFYTPEYITRYIVERTIGTLCNDKKSELNLQNVQNPLNPKKLTKDEKQTLKNIYAYREYLLNLKILDPACGSGAFLNQALEFLIREHQELDLWRKIYEDEFLSLYDIETSVLENNLYGVDINEDAVEIAKLSLWLRTAQKGRVLTNLSEKIKCANSLLDMPFEKNYFDVVIGNPPYIALNKIKNIDYSHFEVYEKTGDILALFIEKSIQLCKIDGLMSFIVSNSWLKTKYGESLKKYLKKHGKTDVINFLGTQIFEDATVESCIVTHYKNDTTTNEIIIKNIHGLNPKSPSFETLTDIINNAHEDTNQLILMKKIEQIGTPLKEWNIKINRGIVTGFNEAFIIDSVTKDELIKADPKSAEIIKPLLRGRDIQKYELDFANKWLIYVHLNISEQQYTYIYEHLFQYKDKLQSRRGGMNQKTGITPYKWWQLQVDYYNSSAYKLFSEPKIVWGEISDKAKFAYDNENYFIEATSFIMTGESLKYLLAFLNSKLSSWYFEQISTTTGMGTNRWKKFKLELLPIPQITETEQQPFLELVDEILEAKEKLKKYKKHFDKLNAIEKIEISEEIEKLEMKIVRCENEIDAMVYLLYGLSDDEIMVVEA